MKNFVVLLLLVLFGVAGTAAAPETKINLEPEWKGGKINVQLRAWPKTLNYYTGSDTYNGFIWQFAGLALLTASPDDFRELPFLADHWEIAKDNLTITYYLNKEATWPDRKPVTAEDVVFSFELAYDRKNCALCEDGRSFIGPYEYVKAVDEHTFQIKMKKKHYRNVARVGGLLILPKHLIKVEDFNKKYNKTILGGGPYVFDDKEFKFRKKIVLKRRKNYWANKYPHFANQYNFDEIVFKYIEDPTVAFEAFKRREIDVLYYNYTMYSFLTNKNDKPFTDKRMEYLEAKMFNPATWQGIAVNMRQGIGADKKVRKAMQYMLNRDLITKKIFNGYLEPVSGPFMKGFKYSSNSPIVPFDLKKASALLKEAGFSKAGPDGVLYREVDENGKKVHQRASMEIMYSQDTHAQWLTVYKEDAKKIGFEINPRLVEWSAAIKKLDEFKFDSFVVGWNGGPYPGPEQLFHGRSAMDKGSSNIPGLNVEKINTLIEEGPAEFNEKKRLVIYHNMEKLIIDEQPYIFRWKEAKHIVTFWKDKLDSTSEPYKKYGGTLERDPFFLHWRIRK